MVEPSKPIIEVSEMTSSQDVLDNLARLNDDLRSLHLEQFLLFNKAYQVVTFSMQQGIKDGYFSNPKFIEAFMVHFARYYFEAVNETANGDSRVTLPWAKLNVYAARPSQPVFVSLMLGASAHINHDLPQVLKTMMKDEEKADLLGDVVKIDKLLMKSGRQSIGLFEEKSGFLNFLKNRFQFMYYRPAMYTILYWRVNAWKAYEQLKKDDASISKITKRSVRTANRILRVSSVLSRIG
jgi:hypothetical protein